MSNLSEGLRAITGGRTLVCREKYELSSFFQGDGLQKSTTEQGCTEGQEKICDVLGRNDNSIPLEFVVSDTFGFIDYQEWFAFRVALDINEISSMARMNCGGKDELGMVGHTAKSMQLFSVTRNSKYAIRKIS